MDKVSASPSRQGDFDLSNKGGRQEVVEVEPMLEREHEICRTVRVVVCEDVLGECFCEMS